MYKNGQIAPAFATANVAGQPQPIGGLGEVLKRLNEQAGRAEMLAGSLEECNAHLEGLPISGQAASVDAPSVGALSNLHGEITRLSEAISRALAFAQQIRNNVA